jgi:DedD protein
MAFFKFRKSSDESAAPAPAPAPESAETLRRRARYRLAGAAFLVIAGVIGFPLLFDNQPRPIAVDIPIEIPDKAKVKPLPGMAELAATTPEAAASRTASGSVASAGAPAAQTTPPSPPAPSATTPVPVQPAKPAVPQSKVDSKSEETIAASPAGAKPDTKPQPQTAAKPVAPPDSKVTKPDAKAGEAAKAQALLDGKAPEAKPADSKPADSTSLDSKPGDLKSAAPAGIRYIVQFGAYSDAAKAHEARVKVEKAGLKTYAQAVDGPDGKKYRVRVGPFASKAEAEKAAEKIKKLDLPAAILEL